MFHALCGTVFSRFSSLVFASAVAPCAKSSFYRENIIFDHVASLCPGKTAGSRSDRVRTICAYVAGRRNALAKTFCAFSHAHTFMKTRNAFSLLSALFEQFAHIASGFATTPPCPARAFVHYARERPCARSGSPTRCGAAAFALQKCAEHSSHQSSKSALAHYILSKRLPYVVFFGGTAFLRHGVLSAPRDKTPSSRILSTTPDIDPCAPSQTAEFAVISGFAVRITSFPVYNCVSKNRRRFRALSAFEKSSLTSAHIRRPFLASFAAFDPRLQSSSATLRARVALLCSPPRKPPSTF